MKFLKCIGLEEKLGTMSQAQINSLKTVRNGVLTCWQRFCKMLKYCLLFVKQKNCWLAKEARLDGTTIIPLSKQTICKCRQSSSTAMEYTMLVKTYVLYSIVADVCINENLKYTIKWNYYLLLSKYVKRMCK